VQCGRSPPTFWRKAFAFLLVSCLAYSLTRRWRQCVPPKHWLTSPGLHSITSQKTVLFKAVKFNVILDIILSNYPFISFSLTMKKETVMLVYRDGLIYNMVVGTVHIQAKVTTQALLLSNGE
jgi:hypothetical protein